MRAQLQLKFLARQLTTVIAREAELSQRRSLAIPLGMVLIFMATSAVSMNTFAAKQHAKKHQVRCTTQKK